MTSAKLIRTDVPGVYARGSRFVAVDRPLGGSTKQQKKAFETKDEAVAFLEERREARRTATAELIRRDREARRRSKDDLSDAYADVRRAEQALDRAPHAKGTGALIRGAYDALQRAEDLIGEAVRLAYLP
jgi:hypothetical protein